MSIWERHWSLQGDPFGQRRSAFVATPGHGEAVARLVHAIESASRSARLIAAAGLGKSRVMTRALEVTRSPDRRLARVSGPTDGADLFARLANELGGRVAPGSSRSVAWRALAEAARLCRWQGLQVVLVVDDCQGLASATDLMDLERLDELDPDPSTRLTVVRLGRPVEVLEVPSEPERPIPAADWSLSVRLAPLTRSETATYIATKLETAGRSEPTFTPRAITRLQAASGGVPRGIDRIAGLALMAGALRGLEMVGPEIIEEAIGDCPSSIEASVANF